MHPHLLLLKGGVEGLLVFGQLILQLFTVGGPQLSYG